METTHKPSPKDWQEGRRLRAWELYQQGWKAVRIAEALGVTRGAVSQWLKAGREGGMEALRQRQRTGRKRRLGAEEMRVLRDLLEKGAEAAGFRGEIWTRQRVAKLIQREFKVKLSPRQVGRLLAEVGWTRQQPLVRASQRDPAAIEQWRRETWPDLKKKPGEKDGRWCL